MDYSIDAVARLTGISAFTLRNWEKRYEFLRPKRLKNGFRSYSEQQIGTLHRISALLKHGARIGDLAQCVRKGKSLPEVHAPELAPGIEERARLLYSSLLQFEPAMAEQGLHHLEKELGPQGLLSQVIEPLLAQLRQEWTARIILPAQERFASEFFRLRLAACLGAETSARAEGAGPTQAEATAPSRAEVTPKKAVFATAPGELRDGELLCLAALLKLRGWQPYYLGTELAFEELETAVGLIRPQLVCVFFADGQAIHAALKTLSRLDCKVCIGGFGALTFDAEESLASHAYLLKNSGVAASALIETLGS